MTEYYLTPAQYSVLTNTLSEAWIRINGQTLLSRVNAFLSALTFGT